MAYEFNGTSQYLSGGVVVTAVPMTYSAWFDTDRSSGYEAWMTQSLTALTDHFFGDISGLQVRAEQRGNTVGAVALSSSFTTGQWRHACSVFTSNASRTAYVDGVAGTPNTSSLTQTANPTNLNIGARTRSSTDGYFDGDLAECAIWNVALTAAEITALAKGFSPRRIRPQSLLFYAPLVRDIADFRAALALTNNNTATVSTHPRVY
jgi:hypothetical protein